MDIKNIVFSFEKYLINTYKVAFSFRPKKDVDITNVVCINYSVECVNGSKTNPYNVFYLDFIFIPYKYRGNSLGSKVILELHKLAKKLNCVEIRLSPFPSDIGDYKFQTYGAINKLVKYYKKQGFALIDESSFKGFFQYETSGNVNYKATCLYDDICSCNEMYLKLK